MKLTERETATVLAALRYWQRNTEQGNVGQDDEFAPIASNNGELTPLDAGDIDDLCERINTDTEPTVIAMQWSYTPTAGYRYFFCNPPINSDRLHEKAAENGFRLVIISQHVTKTDVREMLKLEDSDNLP